MKTIVVVCIATGDAGRSAEKVVAEPNNGSLPGCANLGNQGARFGLERDEREKLTPPFWTWFIENPRPVRRHAGTA